MDNPWSRSVEIPASAFDLTPNEQAKRGELLRAAASLGRAARISVRKIARDAGLKTLPPAQIYVGSRGGPMTLVQASEEDLSILLPEEK